jgi:hypothetical protein
LNKDPQSQGIVFFKKIEVIRLVAFYFLVEKVHNFLSVWSISLIHIYFKKYILQNFGSIIVGNNLRDTYVVGLFELAEFLNRTHWDILRLIIKGIFINRHANGLAWEVSN